MSAANALRLATAEQLHRYASEVDVDFVRKSIKAIGQCAIKIESSAERCVSALMDLINTRVSYVVQEAVVVMKVCFILLTTTKIVCWEFFMLILS